MIRKILKKSVILKVKKMYTVGMNSSYRPCTFFYNDYEEAHLGFGQETHIFRGGLECV